jgi:hypothetical protein
MIPPPPSPLDFSCIPPQDRDVNTNISTPYNLCFHGSCIIVNNITNTQSCMCDPNYIHDYTILHFESCTVPVDVFYINFIIHCVMDFIMTSILIWFCFHTTSRVRKVMLSACCLIIGFFLASLCLYLEQGCEEATSIMLSLVLVCCWVFIYNVVLFIISPLYARHIFIEIMLRRVKILFIIGSCIQFILGIAMCIISSSSNKTTDQQLMYNKVAITWSIWFWVSTIIELSYTVIESRKLRYLVNELHYLSSNNNITTEQQQQQHPVVATTVTNQRLSTTANKPHRTKLLLESLVLVEFALIFAVICFVGLLLAVSSTFFSIGSQPYQWVTVIFQLWLHLVAFIPCAKLGWSSMIDSSSNNNTNNNSIIVVSNNIIKHSIIDEQYPKSATSRETGM